ncbi:hypothetical protein ACFHW2_12155 [Actinomadura sp. LOL_016]|uniref:hypothetical protein n=1 Tax=unclassified Actinomadura TaxID=2626254 RepID=UPI003A7FF2B4
MASRHGRYPTCEACGESVIFAITRAGNRQPLNPAPDPDGNVLAYRDGTGTWRARSLASTREVPAYGHEKTYMPHFATCEGPRQQVLPTNVTPIRRRKR